MALRLSAACAALAVATASAFPPLGKRISFTPTNNLAIGLRHCDYVCSADAPDGSDDFNFKLVAALNGNNAAGSVSIQSVNFPDHYLSPNAGSGGKVGINTSPNADDGSWMLTPGLSDPSNYTLVSQTKSGALADFVLSINASTTNPCSDGPDVSLLAPGDAQATAQTWIVGSPPPPPPPPPSTFTVDTSAVDHVIKREFMGCHMDPGYTQDPLGWTANLVYGQAFETSPASRIYAWNDVTSPGVTATVALDAAVHVNPSVSLPALSVAFTSGTGVAGWSNRGIGNEGLYLQALPYEGYVLVLAPQAVTLYVGLHNRDAKTVLDSASIAVAGAPGWQKVRARGVRAFTPRPRSRRARTPPPLRARSHAHARAARPPLRFPLRCRRPRRQCAARSRPAATRRSTAATWGPTPATFASAARASLSWAWRRRAARILASRSSCRASGAASRACPCRGWASRRSCRWASRPSGRAAPSRSPFAGRTGSP